MGMLLYMMEQQNKENNKKAAGVAKQATPKPVSKKEPEKKVEVEVAQETKKPTRMEIMRMNVATVREYAESQGIENANTMSGAELKRILVNKMFEEE